MDILEKHHHYILLFDFYSVILTQKQQDYFSDYYFKDASLAEIAKENGISRAAVFDQLHRVHQLLDEYEAKLKLYEKFVQRNNVFDQFSQTSNPQILQLIEKLKEIE
ncbi:MAG: YlxM family DNA-binding protein [Bacilli bacterium]